MNQLVEIMPSAALPMQSRDVVDHSKLVRTVVKEVMVKDLHFGTIPGTDKDTLFQPGAETLLMTFRVAATFEVEDLSTHDCASYRVRCIGKHQVTGNLLGEGMGSCSSYEAKYKWQRAYGREFNATPEDRRRIKYGWDNKKREEYEILQIRTEAADIDNTVLKMAVKRAKVAMAISVTACSDLFSQDLEDEEVRDAKREQRKGPTSGKPKTEPPKAKVDATNEKINANKVGFVLGELNNKGKSAADLCAHFKVDEVKLLNMSDWQAVLTWINEPAPATETE